jgi:hypothetical protein
MDFFHFQQEQLETSCQKTHELMERDLNPFLIDELTDRSPFYKFRSELITHLKALQHHQESFSEAIYVETFDWQNLLEFRILITSF